MIARSGNMQIAPMAPVKVIRGRRRRTWRAGRATARARRDAHWYNGGFRRRAKTRHSSVCPSTNSRIRSPGCPSSQGCICTSTRPARRSTSARRGRCATACGTISGAYGADPKTDALLDEIARLEVIVTDSVVEALALENNLIKQRSAEVQHPAARRQELSRTCS